MNEARSMSMMPSLADDNFIGGCIPLDDFQNLGQYTLQAAPIINGKRRKFNAFVLCKHGPKYEQGRFISAKKRQTPE
ncbi:hypothetical protein ACLKA7_016910 [Drosophila subpalustris]